MVSGRTGLQCNRFPGPLPEIRHFPVKPGTRIQPVQAPDRAAKNHRVPSSRPVPRTLTVPSAEAILPVPAICPWYRADDHSQHRKAV